MSQTDIINSLNTMYEARKELLIKKNYANSIKTLIELISYKNLSNNDFLKNTLALAYLENKDYSEAAKIYYELDQKYQAGFCELLMGNIYTARDIWYKIPESEASCWGKSLLDLIDLKKNYLPTFIQIRNHLECDLGYFIQADRLEYVENITKCSDILASINPEAYKFIGKALLNNGFANLSINYFLKSQRLIPQDSENYYHLGQYSCLAGAYEEGKEMLNHCLLLNQYYVPARNLLEKIEAKIKNS
ncbi:MAG: hypothetical protein A2287_08750 [Candidatus Melainabacteria bacterium RIFOXYA12_FULL_32_12]|nr:MAG: hypothetical protein A2287_08750 [Candidatus Melainabacteria bacterium RIFOXYA12_FULL_32_12]